MRRRFGYSLQGLMYLWEGIIWIYQSHKTRELLLIVHVLCRSRMSYEYFILETADPSYREKHYDRASQPLVISHNMYSIDPTSCAGDMKGVSADCVSVYGEGIVSTV